jgi:toxin ParE1/3/4
VVRSVILLDSAKEEFKEIKKYVQLEFGDSVWNAVNAEYKKAIQRIKKSPRAGSPVDEVTEVGITNVKYVLVRQTKIVYEFDETQVLVHMFINTKRDFRTHLLKRLLRQ